VTDGEAVQRDDDDDDNDDGDDDAEMKMMGRGTVGRMGTAETMFRHGNHRDSAPETGQVRARQPKSSTGAQPADQPALVSQVSQQPVSGCSS
jgi:hypothetical protein